ncbi:sulfur oxidation c-type cytochrome SoxX [Alphaproteobacteria bacterium GH1-50]|uniref:Sulfur oxidation c-type cytochrome SoxX n=1 Tax=Kangsaoukella pontilimi TaxID=2691042 RepID=A0A7C9INM3_9RHOB|nr:sulfur oxidation c-type cytochrome SoxX [Kangsaoukella pontilimi]MXQ07470.1 sulfur oxidation c-type cytochrome SoxX [Kangsaoukella pontilimi]
MKKMLVTAGLITAFALPLHAEMVAPTQVAFTDGAVEGSLTGTAGDPAAGRVIMNKGAGNCIACHMVSDLEEFPFHGDVGPSLDGVGDRWTEAELRGIVSNAKEMFPDTVMPSFYRTTDFVRPGNGFTGKAAEGELDPLLTAQQVEDVVSYLLTLKE